MLFVSKSGFYLERMTQAKCKGLLVQWSCLAFSFPQNLFSLSTLTKTYEEDFLPDHIP